MDNMESKKLDSEYQKSNLKLDSTNKEKVAILDLKTSIPQIDELFNIHKIIGQGTFSTVFLATLRNEKWNRKHYALKYLIPTSHPNRIEGELKCLLDVGHKSNVIGIDLCLREEGYVAFVMPYIPHERFQDYFHMMTTKEIQSYMKELLLALEHIHNHNIIHRDVKPPNFLVDRINNKFLLVDFGLAQYQKLIVEDYNSSKKRKKFSYFENSEAGPSYDNHPQKRLKLTSDSNINSESMSRKCSSDDELLFTSPLRQILHHKSHKNHTITKTKCTDMSGNFEVNTPLLNLKTNISSVLRQLSSDNKNIVERKNSSRQCSCYGKRQICNICIVRRDIPASRAGTRGYRPPEVLLKSSKQTTAIDIWAAGVIFISLLSSCYPFFLADDDLSGLAEIITIFGDEKIRKTAISLNRHILISLKKNPLNLQKLCFMLRTVTRQQPIKNIGEIKKKCDNCLQTVAICVCEISGSSKVLIDEKFPIQAFDLLSKLLEVNPKFRITATEALKHSYFKI